MSESAIRFLVESGLGDLTRAGLRDHVDEDVDAGLPITMGVQPNQLVGPTPRCAPRGSTASIVLMDNAERLTLG